MSAMGSFPFPVLAELESRSAAQTRALGERLGAAMPIPAVLGLVGELGSGKTLLTKGLARGLGVREADRVNSPTFVVMQEYVGRARIHHYDTYRLEGSAELAAIGFEEDLDPREPLVVVVEWADRVADLLPPETLVVELEHAGTADDPGDDSGTRRVTFCGDPDRWRAVVDDAIGAA